RGVDATDPRQLPEPEIPLLGAGAHEEVAPGQLRVDRLRRALHCFAPLGLSEVARLLELLEMEGVVDVDDDDLRGPLQEGKMGHQVALEDQDVTPILELPQLGL